MSDELKVLEIVAKRLKTLNIAYMISGSIAANYYTIPRMTRDIDIVIELQHNAIDKFVTDFKEDFYIDKESVKEAVSRKAIFNIIHNELIVKVDLILRKESLFDRNAFSRKKLIKINQIDLYLISPEDLVIAKLLWAKKSLSELQLKDVSNIIKTVEDLDVKYMEQWIKELGLMDLYRRVTNG